MSLPIVLLRLVLKELWKQLAYYPREPSDYPRLTVTSSELNLIIKADVFSPSRLSDWTRWIKPEVSHHQFPCCWKVRRDRFSVSCRRIQRNTRWLASVQMQRRLSCRARRCRETERGGVIYKGNRRLTQLVLVCWSTEQEVPPALLKFYDTFKVPLGTPPAA